MANDKKRNEVLKGFTTASLLGYLGYKHIDADSIDSVKKATKTITEQAGTKSEIRQVGEDLRSNVDVLKESMNRSKKLAIDNLRERFASEIENYFPSGDDGIKNADEARAFFSALFDAVREDDMIMSGNDTDIDDAIRRMYDAVSDPTGNKVDDALMHRDKQTLTKFFDDSFSSNDVSLERFGKHYQRYISNIELFADASRKSNVFASIPNQKHIESMNNLDDYFAQNANSNRGVITDRFNRLKTRFGRSTANINLRAVNEGGGASSLYAQVKLNNSKVFNVPLFLGADETGNTIFRATEELGGSSYVAPNDIIQANKILRGANLSSSKYTTLAEARAGGAVVDFNTYIFDEILALNPAKLAGLSQREINDLTAFQRNFGLDAPRTMSSEYKGLISGNLYSNLKASRAMQSSNAVVTGIEAFNYGQQKNVVKNLLGFFQEELIGVNAAQTMTARYDDPFNKDQTKLFGNIGVRTVAGQKAINPFNAIETYGRLDRALLPQTAREGQMFGRYEAIEGLGGANTKTTFGKTALPMVANAHSGRLLGVNAQGAGGTVGLNLAGIFIKGSAATKTLGLAEGVSYFGGRVTTSTSMPKTIVESGLADTKLMEELTGYAKGQGKKGIMVGSVAVPDSDLYHQIGIDDFFQKYGNRDGVALLGHLDSDFSGIKRRAGMEGFTLSLVEHGAGSGRDKFFTVGQMNNVNMNTKLFSWLVKDTTLELTDSGLTQKLNAINSNISDSVERSYFNTMGGNLNNTLLSSTDQLKKSVYNLTSGIFGALEMGGVKKSVIMSTMDSMVNKEADYLKRINSLYGTTYSSLKEASVLHRRGAYLDAAVDTAIKVGQSSLGSEALGYVLGSVEEHGSRFGYAYSGGQPGEEGLMQQRLQKFGLGNDDAFNQALRSNFVFAAGYGTTGGVHAELGRNLARVEPRFFNYNYTALRANFGLSADEATRYMSSMLVRQKGVESKASSLFGMHLNMMSLSPLNEIDMQKMVSGLGDLPTMDVGDLRTLMSFVQGDEKALADFLSENQKGQILDLEDLIADRGNLKTIKDQLGGRSKIFLPGAETLENFTGFKIRSAGQSIGIENEYNRYLTDLISSISGLSEAQTPEEFDQHLRGFNASKQFLGGVVGSGIRQSLSGDMLGSGSYMGSGFKFGADEAGSTLWESGKTSRQGLLDAFNQKKGYALFMDAQAFMDGMTTYDQALTKELRANGVAEKDIRSRVKARTSERLQDFFFGMYGSEKTGPTGLGMRNPNIFITHFLPGVSLMRYDFAQGNQDAMFKYFKEYRGVFLNEEGVRAQVDARRKMVTDKRLAFFNAKTQNNLNTDSYEKYIAERKRLIAAKKGVSTRLSGELAVDPEGHLLEEEYTYKDKDGKEVRGTRKQRVGTTDPNMRASIVADELFFRQLREDIEARGVNQNAKKALLGNVRGATSDELTKVGAINLALNKGGAEDFSSLTGRSSQIYSNALHRKLEMVRASTIHKHKVGEVKVTLHKIKLESIKRIEGLERKLGQSLSSEEETKIRAEIRKLEKARETATRLLDQKEKVGLNTLSGNDRELRMKYARDFFVSDHGKFKTDMSDAGYDARGKVSARQLWATDYTLTREGDLKVANWELNQKVAGLELKEAYDDVARHAPRNPVEFLQRAKTINVLRRQLEIEAISGNVISLESEVNKIDKEITKLNAEPTTPENAAKINALQKQKALAESGIADASLRLEGEEMDYRKHGSKLTRSQSADDIKGQAGLRRQLEDLRTVKIETSATGEESSKHMNINKRIAAEALHDYREARHLQRLSTPELDGFYGTGGEGKQGIIKYLQENVGGEDKPHQSVSKATSHLIGASSPASDFREVIYNQNFFDDEGKYIETKPVIKTFKMTERAAERLGSLDEELARLNDTASQTNVKAHKDQSLYRQTLAEKDDILKQMDTLATNSQAEEEFRQANIRENNIKEFDQRSVKLSQAEMNQIYEDLPGEYKKSWEDLSIARQGELLNDKKAFSVLSNLEEHLGGGRIESFEELLERSKAHLTESLNVHRGGGEVISTVGEEIDRMFLGMLGQHSRHGEHGGGIVRFPEINIEANMFNASGESLRYEGRMDVSRFMIGDFDADIYQIYHDTNRALGKRFQQKNASFHGFYQAGAEYLFNMRLLGEGMERFGERLGVSGMTFSESLLDEYSKEKILKDVGGIDVQVKTGMLSIIQGAHEAAARGEDVGGIYRRVRAGASLVAVAQEVLVIKAKKLDVAAGVADEFLHVMRNSFSSGSGEELFDFFQKHIFRDTIQSSGSEISVSDIKFTDLPEGMATREIRTALEQVKLGTGNLREVFDDMARIGKNLNVLALGSDKRLTDVLHSSDVFTLRQFNQLLSVGLEGGFMGADGSWDVNKVQSGLRNVEREISNAFKMSAQGKGVGALALGAVAASYLIGAGSSVNTLSPENKFSDMKSKSLERSAIQNNDHSDINHQGLSRMGDSSGFHMRPINIGNSYVTTSNAAKMYGEAPSYSSAMGAARNFTSVGGQAFVSVQDNRRPISNNYITRSLRD